MTKISSDINPSITPTPMPTLSPPAPKTLTPPTLPDIKTFLLAISSVLIVWIPILSLHLVLVMFSAMIVYAVTRGMANWLRGHVFRYFPNHRIIQKTQLYDTHNTRAEMLSLLVLLVGMTGCIYIFGDWVADKANTEVFNQLLIQILSIFDQLHTLLPASIAQYLPNSLLAFKEMFLGTIKHHAPQLQLAGIHTLRGVGYVLIGSVIGAIAVIQVPASPQPRIIPEPSTTDETTSNQLAIPAKPDNLVRPLAVHLRGKFDELMAGFNDVFFAQVRISSINTVLTSIYLLGILPAVGHPLPMGWTLVIITFLAGMIPVIGNLFSNVVIVLLSLTHGLGVSIASLLWLVSIHKLEYFLNAQIIGHKIRATAWELLIFMLLLEASFGIAGMIAAPTIYAQIKRILTRHKWV